ncbi:hypothetical protein BU15DRAFT_44673 [Melanogaster broomeanus]|nr:hypothetical protein BU15DRAFT_44673 [Melanogaster broomeanus]
MLKQTACRTRNTLLYDTRRSRGYASGSSNAFPYPTQPNPQPHHIFHLPRSATQQQIKERYYELVRIYHPDSPVARKYPPEVAHARFQSITKAYDLMRGKSSLTGESLAGREQHMGPARFRTGTSRRPHFDDTTGDERWKERLLFGVTVLSIAVFVAQTTFTRREAIAQATSRSRPASSASKDSLGDEALAASSIRSSDSRSS